MLSSVYFLVNVCFGTWSFLRKIEVWYDGITVDAFIADWPPIHNTFPQLLSSFLFPLQRNTWAANPSFVQRTYQLFLWSPSIQSCPFFYCFDPHSFDSVFVCIAASLDYWLMQCNHSFFLSVDNHTIGIHSLDLTPFVRSILMLFVQSNSNVRVVYSTVSFLGWRHLPSICSLIMCVFNWAITSSFNHDC